MSNVCYNKDCMEGMKEFPDKYFDLAICDIPYGINVGRMAYLKEKKHAVMQKNGNKLSAHSKRKVYTLKDWDLETPTQEYFNELRRVSKEQIIFGVEYVNWQGLGNGRIKWNKGVPEGVSFKTYEMAYCSMIEQTIDLPLLWSGMRQAKSLKHPMIQQGNKKLNEKRNHPCYKPQLLYEKLIYDYGFLGCKIIDTHVGGGSIRIACDKAKVDFTGFEIDEEYYHKQEEKYKTFLQSPTLW